MQSNFIPKIDLGRVSNESYLPNDNHQNTLFPFLFFVVDCMLK